jgi:hypothetical protein
VPSRLNNYVVDVNYTARGSAAAMLLGGSCQRGSAYCQGFPVEHFLGCDDHNPAFDVYAQVTAGDLIVQAEVARTTEAWSALSTPPSRSSRPTGSAVSTSAASIVCRSAKPRSTYRSTSAASLRGQRVRPGTTRISWWWAWRRFRRPT